MESGREPQSGCLLPSKDQVEAYLRDGFLLVERFAPTDEVQQLRARFAEVFAHHFETGIAPDEVNYTPGETAPELTRQMCNVWKADRVIATTVLSERNGAFAARLGGLSGVILDQDNLIWKPPSGKALLCHQDAAYLGHLDPPNMTTCWISLDDTRADSGTIYYVRGSHRWPRAPAAGTFHGPEQWLDHVRRVKPDGVEIDLVPIEVPAGGAAFHDGWVFHGSPPNERKDAERRSVISHFVAGYTRWSDGPAHPIYSRYRRPGDHELDEAFFPVVWRSDGYRTPWLDGYVAGASASH
ncbi:MAG: phytanoyl-CoA dioxygenase family protein [Acidimicrobiales bacterium]